MLRCGKSYYLAFSRALLTCVSVPYTVVYYHILLLAMTSHAYSTGTKSNFWENYTSDDDTWFGVSSSSPPNIMSSTVVESSLTYACLLTKLLFYFIVK